MSPYIYNPNSRYNTLTSKKTNGYIYQIDRYELIVLFFYFNIKIKFRSCLLYDLVGIVRHHGERANSGHYTATTRNLVDNCWRNYDDIKVTIMSETADIRFSNNSYLLFYEKKVLSTKNNAFLKSTALWFTSNVPRSVQTFCEKQRYFICDNNKKNNIKKI